MTADAKSGCLTTLAVDGGGSLRFDNGVIEFKNNSCLKVGEGGTLLLDNSWSQTKFTVGSELCVDGGLLMVTNLFAQFCFYGGTGMTKLCVTNGGSFVIHRTDQKGDFRLLEGTRLAVHNGSVVFDDCTPKNLGSILYQYGGDIHVSGDSLLSLGNRGLRLGHGKIWIGGSTKVVWGASGGASGYDRYVFGPYAEGVTCDVTFAESSYIRPALVAREEGDLI